MEFKKLQVLKTELNIGLPSPVKLLHVTDTHIAYADPERPCGRQARFDGEIEDQTANYFEQSLAYAKEQNLTMLHTGDLLDFLSRRSFDYIDEKLQNVDYIYAAGNHDYCHWVGEAKEDNAYKWENMKISAPHFKSNLWFDSRVIGGLNIVTLDNSYYRISDGQLEMLRAEAAKGLPILLCMHNPLFTQNLADLILGHNPNSDLAVVAAPRDYLYRYNDHRFLQQVPDDATLRAVDYIKTEPMIKALITGHLHLNFEDTLDNGVPQIITHGTYAGYVRELTIL